MKKRFVAGLLISLLLYAGCETVDTKLDVPDGRNSSNSRYEDDDIIGPVLKLRLKETPSQQEENQARLAEQSLDADY